MLPSRLFRSRWSALFWAAGILWTAYDVAMASRAPAATNTADPIAQDATGDAARADDLAVLANSGG